MIRVDEEFIINVLEDEGVDLSFNQATEILNLLDFESLESSFDAGESEDEAFELIKGDLIEQFNSIDE